MSERVTYHVELEKLLIAAGEGVFDGLRCPRCGQDAISVWFTHPAENRYWVWMDCQKCKLHTHHNFCGAPPGFREERINPAFEALDRELLARAKFPDPNTP